MEENRIFALFPWLKDLRWRNKCNRSIKRARYQLLLRRNRMKCIIRHSREDIAQLVTHNQDIRQAFDRVEKLHHDEGRLLAYHELEDFLVKICSHIHKLSRRVDKLGLEMHEAVSSVVWAASCCGELAELRRVRDLFAKWFGDDFRKLSTENFVHCSIKHKLSEMPVPEDVKLHLVSQISKEYSTEIDSVSNIHDRKVDQVMTKHCVFHDVFRRMIMCSNFSDLEARSSNLVTPHRDSCNNSEVDDTAENNIKKKHEGESFIEPKDESSSSNNGKAVVNEKEEDVEEENLMPRRSYVHPKLPDYDELVATFTEYKKECRKNITPKDENNGVVTSWMPWLKVNIAS